MMVAFYSSSSTIREIEGVSETFRLLKERGVKIGIDTGFDRKIADAIFDRMGWEEKGLIDYTITSDEVENGRPHPDMVYKAMSKFNITDSSEVGKVGDTPADLNEGNNAGCGLNIGVLSGAYRLDQLEQHPHTHIVESVVSIPELLETV
jgi:phosphonatase-like hydrolase